MTTPDVNVLVAASRRDHPHHATALRCLEDSLAATQAGAAFTLLPMVLAGFLRLVTSRRIFHVPTPIEHATSFVDALLAVGGVQLAGQGPEWPRLRQLCLDRRLQGNNLPDAWLAATVDQLGEHLVTFDRGFAKLLRRSQYTLLDPAAAP